MRKKIPNFILLFLTACSCLYAQNPATPMMGWSSWNTFRIDINEELIVQTADSMVSKGLKEAGYTFLNIDDGFFAGRGTDGKLKNNNAKFPNGMRAIADSIHARGLKAGIYSEAGDKTCAYYWDDDKVNGLNVGFYGHEEQDARMYFDEWDYDFIKIDYCGAEYLKLDEKTQYSKIWDAIRNTDKVKRGESVRWNVCRWMFPGVWATEIAGSWRISHDIYNSFDSDRGVRGILEQNLYLAAYASPGHFNDMDMMQIGRKTFSENEEKSHFALWCIMSSPLMIGCDIRSIPQSTVDIITNREVIAVNQDVLGLQARLISRSGKQFVLAKPIETDQGKVRAVALFNGESSAKTMRIHFADIQLSETAHVRDLWTHKDLGSFEGYYEVNVPSHGTAMLRIEGESSFDKTVFEGEYAFINEYNEVFIDNKSYTGARFSYKFGASGDYILSDLGARENNWAEFRDVYSTTGGKYKFKLFYYSATDKTLTVTVNETPYVMTGLNSGGENRRGRAFIHEIELRPGYNTIRLSNKSGNAPEIDKFVLLDPNDPGDDNEPDYLPDDEVIVNTKFPAISSEDNSDETWYYIQFRSENGVLQDMGENNNLITAQKLVDSDDQLWKVTGSSNKYSIVSKNGRKINYANNYFTGSQDSPLLLKIVATANTTHAPAWEIQRSSSSKSMNQWGGAGIGKELGEWNANDSNNPLLFVAAEKELNYMPEISTDEKEHWYYIRFEKGEKVLQEMGDGKNLTIQTPEENNGSQLWKVTGTRDNYLLTSKSGLVLKFSDDFYQATADKNAPLRFKFIFTTNTNYAPGWELQRPDVENRCMNQYQNNNAGQPVSEWTKGDDNNVLNFLHPSEIGFSDPIEGFPEISDNSREKWYYIQFKNGNGVLQDMGNDTNLRTKGITTDEAQHWKVVKTNNTPPFIYQIVNKSGRRINHTSSAETGDGLYQATGNPALATHFNIVESTHTTYTPAFELHRQGSSRHMNQYKGAGIDRLISEWNKGDGGNPLVFIAVEDAEIIRAKMPEISTDEKEFWYNVCFSDVVDGKTAYLTDMLGNAEAIEGELMTKEAVDESESQMWKVVFSQKKGDKDYYQIISGTKRNIYWNGEKYMANSSEFTRMKFNELAPYWVLEREGGSDGQGMSQKAKGPEQELIDKWNSEGFGRLTFIKVDKVSIPEVTTLPRGSFEIRDRQLFIKGEGISRVAIYTAEGKGLYSQTKGFRFNFANPGTYVASITYSDGYSENKKLTIY